MSLARRGGRAAIVGLLALGVLVVGVSGAVAALGDTLFPATSLAHALQQDLSPTSHVLLRLRVIHPTLAVIVALALIVVAPRLPDRRRGRTDAAIGPGARVALLAGLQAALGGLNVLLLAPVWLQLVHLLVADLLWIAVVLLGAAALAGRAARAAYSRIRGRAVHRRHGHVEHPQVEPQLGAMVHAVVQARRTAAPSRAAR